MIGVQKKNVQGAKRATIFHARVPGSTVFLLLMIFIVTEVD